jgi:hypothetical protein
LFKDGKLQSMAHHHDRGRGNEDGCSADVNLMGRVLGPDIMDAKQAGMVDVGGASTRIIDISCGVTHILCVSEQGTVYSWGYDECGRKTRANIK